MKVIKLADYQSFSVEKMKKNNIFQTPRFFCDVYCFEPGQEQKGHIHGEQDKVYLVLEGQGTFQVGAEKQILGPGQGTMAPAGEEHGVKNDSGQRLKVLVFVAPNPSRLLKTPFFSPPFSPPFSHGCFVSQRSKAQHTGRAIGGWVRMFCLGFSLAAALL